MARRDELGRNNGVRVGSIRPADHELREVVGWDRQRFQKPPIWR